MNLLMIGDIVGAPGRAGFATALFRMRQSMTIDFVVANGENAAGGKGVTRSIAEELFRAGADVITMGDHVWDQKELVSYIDVEPRIIRPANLPPGSPGSGCSSFATPMGPVTVVSILGRVFMRSQDCPFRTMDSILKPERNRGKVIIVDFHAEATSEKVAMGRYLDGRVSFLGGTHTHVQTSDECVLQGGTGYITDLGMTGPKDSVIGRDVQSVLQAFVRGMPTRFEIPSGDVRMEGVLVDIDETTGKTRSVVRVREPGLE